MSLLLEINAALQHTFPECEEVLSVNWEEGILNLSFLSDGQILHVVTQPPFISGGLRVDPFSNMDRLDKACGNGFIADNKKCTKNQGVVNLNPDKILADPKRFQYKIIGEHTKTGEVGSLSGVQKYDPNLAGIIQVWKDPKDGNTYVVNGHNRLALAKKLGADSVTVRYLDVKSPKEARAIGALTNIAEGRGTAIDAAKFFKDTGITKEDLSKKGIPMREKIATEGIAVSQLNDRLFRKVIDGDLPIERASIIGGSGLDKSEQDSLFDLAESQAKKGKKITNDVLEELIDTVKLSQSQSEMQFDLFGASEVTKSNAIERASLQAAIKRKLSRDKKLFGLVSKSQAAKDLESAGNLIDVEKSSDISQKAATTLAVFDQLKNMSGDISDSINSAATAIQNGGNRKQIESELYKQITESIPKYLGGKS